MKGNSLFISVFVLALAFVISAWMISHSLNTYHDGTSKAPVHEKQLLTKEEIAVYLGITAAQFDELDQSQTAMVGRRIPFILSGDTTYYTIQGIEVWLSERNTY